jgi:hypothetical protein
LDWSEPWGAASHVSHQFFMLTANHRLFGLSEQYDVIIDEFGRNLSTLRDPESGSWFKGKPSDTIKINGAMKMFSGFEWLERSYPDSRKLLDFALQQPFQEHGCSFLNRIFVVWQARKGAPQGYRQEEVHALALEALSRTDNYRQLDGAFSFYPTRAQTNYYGARVSRGLRESDLHGTTMLVWAIAISLDLLGDETDAEVQHWKVQKV